MIFNTIIIFLCAVGLICFFIIGLSLACYLGAFYNNVKKKDQSYNLLTGEQYDVYHDKMLKAINDCFNFPFEEVFIKSFDNLSLYGRYFKVNDDGPILIEFHGYKGNGIRDLSTGLTYILSCGINVLMVDQRGHGKSEGRTISFGIKERYDVLSWINYVNGRFEEHRKIVLFGVSLGAETVLMASELDLPKNVVGIMADSPFSSPKEIVLKVTKEMKIAKTIPSGFFAPFFVIGAKLFGRFNLNETTAVKAVKKSKIPILIVHGTDDRFVPYKMSEEIKEASPSNISLQLFEKAGHGISYYKDEDKYKKIMKDFVIN